jgi:hypothetical protein
MEIQEAIKKRIEINLPHLDERQSRIYLASEAESYGWGGITQVSKLSGVSQKTIQLGIKELKNLVW